MTLYVHILQVTTDYIAIIDLLLVYFYRHFSWNFFRLQII